MIDRRHERKKKPAYKPSELYSLTTNVMGEDPRTGSLFVFCNRRRSRVKTFYWDATGLWVMTKRLEKGTYAYVWLDAIWLKRSWSGEVQNVSVLVAIGVGEDGYREVLGVEEGAREDKESWPSFLKALKGRGLKGTELFITDKCLGLVDSIGEVYPEAKWQWCVVHWYRNVMGSVPRTRLKDVVAMLKAIHAQEDRTAGLTHGK